MEMINFFRKLFKRKIKYLNGGISLDLEEVKSEKEFERNLDSLLSVLKCGFIEEYEKLRRNNG